MFRYGHGVYFANEASTSMSSYARSSGSCRPNADFPISTATALVELGELPVSPARSRPDMGVVADSPPSQCSRDFCVSEPSLRWYVTVADDHPRSDDAESHRQSVANTKQIKPFLLLVTGQKQQSVTDFEAVSTVKKAGSGSAPRAGKLYEHDPELRMLTTFYGQPLRVVRCFSASQSLNIDS